MIKLKAAAIIGLAISAILAAALYGSYRHGVKVTALEWQGKWDELQIELTTKRLEQEQKYRGQEQAWQLQIEKIEVENVELQNRILANSVVADNTSDRLLDKINSYAKRLKACSASTAANNGKTEASPELLFPELFRKLDQRTGELARFADESRSAGLACEHYVKTVRQ